MILRVKMVCKPWMGVFSVRVTLGRQRVVVEKSGHAVSETRPATAAASLASGHSSCICCCFFFLLQIEWNLFLITAKKTHLSGFDVNKTVFSESKLCYLYENVLLYFLTSWLPTTALSLPAAGTGGRFRHKVRVSSACDSEKNRQCVLRWSLMMRGEGV